MALATALAAWLKPWRVLGAQGGPPWPWFIVALLLPLLWTADRWSGQAATPLVSGGVLLLLLAGWPLTMLAVAMAGLLAWADGSLPADVVLVRCFWLGTLPATVALALGALVRCWGSGWVFGYLFGRGFAATLASLWIAQALAGAHAAQAAAVEATEAAGALGRAVGVAAFGMQVGVPAWLLTGFAEACLTGLVVAATVALRPAWVATWAGRLYGGAESGSVSAANERRGRGHGSRR